jgi:hypothetical protein
MTAWSERCAAGARVTGATLPVRGIGTRHDAGARAVVVHGSASVRCAAGARVIAAVLPVLGFAPSRRAVASAAVRLCASSRPAGVVVALPGRVSRPAPSGGAAR